VKGLKNDPVVFKLLIGLGAAFKKKLMKKREKQVFKKFSWEDFLTRQLATSSGFSHDQQLSSFPSLISIQVQAKSLVRI
jgi:hypothetical protein